MSDHSDEVKDEEITKLVVDMHVSAEKIAEIQATINQLIDALNELLKQRQEAKLASSNRPKNHLLRRITEMRYRT